MRLGFNFPNGLLDTPLDDLLTFSAQYGATDVVLQSYTGMDAKSRWAVVPGDNRWELRDLESLRKQVESHGLHLEALENVPSFFDRKLRFFCSKNFSIENFENFSSTFFFSNFF